MNNVHAVVLRAVGCCLHSSSWLRPYQIIVHHPRVPHDIIHRSFTTSSKIVRPLTSDRNLSSQVTIPRSFKHVQTRHIQVSASLYASQQRQQPAEQGLAFRDTSLSSAELHSVYGEAIPPPHIANRLLRVLHGRRIDGTLDLPLPRDMTNLLRRYPYAQDSALFWLRTQYPIDEDEAILARIEREEAEQDGETPSELMQRGQNAGIYGPQASTQYNDAAGTRDDGYYGPQSGQYQARLSEQEGDVFGRSEIDRIRAQNEADAAREEQELEQQISEIQEKATAIRAQDTALASRPEQGVEATQGEIRPPNEFEKWILRAKNRATSKLTLESPEVKDRSTASRLIPSLLFTVAVCGGLYVFSQSWVPPKRSERIWPDMSLSFATVAGIIAVNASVWLLWRFPPAFSVLNKYFLVVPATIRPLSLLGNIFSHTGTKHLLVNAVPLIVFGPSLHEDIGRGNFIALYIAAGVIGSYMSLARYVTQGVLITSALGASGCTWGVTGAFLNLHSNDKFTVFFLPEDVKDKLCIKGWMFFMGLLGVELVGVLTGRLQRLRVDYIAHFAGAAVGWLFADIWKRKESMSRQNGDFVPKPTRPWWQFFQKESDSANRGS